MNGVLVVDKSVGYTSRDVVNMVSKKLGTKKVGHTGTLDPLASGVLVLCVGSALKVAELITCEDKEYIAKVRLGYETDTLDSEGEIIKTIPYQKYTKQEIESVLREFIGKIKQEVPKYSAVKVRGKKLYEYARSGMEVKLPIREVTIHSLKLIGDIEIQNGYTEFSIQCKVSKGTYIRSLVRDIGIHLKSCATMIELRRIQQGKFNIESAYKIEDIQNDNYQLLETGDVLDIDKIIASDELAFKVKNGQVLDSFFKQDMILIYNQKKELLAIYKQCENGKVKPFKVFG